jgi:hypothetical protein
MSMDDLMLEVEETALFLDQIYSKKWAPLTQKQWINPEENNIDGIQWIVDD